jgi:hypothetical protein
MDIEELFWNILLIYQENNNWFNISDKKCLHILSLIDCEFVYLNTYN